MKTTVIRSTLWSAAIGMGAALLTPSASTAQDAIVFRSGGIEKLMPSEKDRALREALQLLGERIEELPQEFNQRDVPAGPIRAIYEMLMSPMALSVAVDPDADPQQGPPVKVQMIVESADPAAAERRARMVFGLLERGMGGGGLMNVPGMPGMKMIDLNGMRGLIGTMNVGGKSSFVVMVNRDVPAPLALGSMGLPSGVDPVFGFSIDMKPLQPLVEMAMPQPAPGVERIRAQLEVQGLLGEHPLSMTAGFGFGGGFAHGVLNYGNYYVNPLNRVMVSDKRLTEIDLAMIPGDATFAQVSHSKLSALPQMLAESLKPYADEEGLHVPTYEEMLAEFEAQTGVNPDTQFFAYLGTRSGIYMSDTTGGGGLNSTIAFAEVTNAEGMQRTLERFAEMVSGAGEGMARGFVRVDRLPETVLANAWVLRFPGLPIPLELTVTLERGHLWVGASPQAVVAAIAHAKNPGNGLMGNARFRELSNGVPRDAMAMSFTDSPKLAARGYGLASMAMSALSNAVRSPRDPERGAGLVMPGLRELLDGAKGSLMVTRITASDMTITTKSDPSFLVNGCAAVGAVGSSPVAIGAIALGAGVAMPAFNTARESAKQVKAGSQLSQLFQAVVVYQQEHDRLPPDVETLIRENYISESLLVSPLGSVRDDHPDLWINLQDPRIMQFDSDRIVGYDRGAYLYTQTLAVLFADGHVEQIPTWDFEAMITDEKYKDVDFRLPGNW